MMTPRDDDLLPRNIRLVARDCFCWSLARSAIDADDTGSVGERNSWQFDVVECCRCSNEPLDPSIAVA